MIEPVRIGKRLVGPGHKPFVIAEACVNHQGQVAIAEKMVYIAHAMGADAIKFQLHVPENEMLKVVPVSNNFDKPLYDILLETHLTLEEHARLKALCDRLGIMYLCTPFSRAAGDMLETIGIEAYKTGSGELTNLPLQEHLAKKGKPMIVSTGMCTIDEVGETVEVVKRCGAPLVLTHCVSAYPAPYHIVNLDLVPEYEKRFQVPVGLSDHTKGIYTCLGAVALGACVLEKHFTLDRQWSGPDHPVSIEPYELGELVKGAEAIFLARGAERRIFPEEQQIVAWARESVVSEKAIPRGSVIVPDMVWVKRPSPADGVVPAKHLNQVIGRVAAVDIPPDVQVRWEYLR